jgi:cysteine desulfurase family protein
MGPAVHVIEPSGIAVGHPRGEVVQFTDRELAGVVYLDNAATSWPKPPEVVRAVTDFLERVGGNPGRAGHRLSTQASRIVYDAREALAELFHVADPLRILFAPNITQAINTALCGLLRPGDRVVTTSVEHNAVMRPLRALERQGVQVSVVRCASDGTLDLGAFAEAVRPGTRLVVATHANNVTGTILPIGDMAAVARYVGAFMLVDAAQTAGVLPIDMPGLGIDLLAFTGHKGLQGPQGTGGLILGERIDPARIDPLVRGGTGSNSEYDEQPEELPDKFESGTPNGLGIAGLGAGVRVVLTRGVAAIRAHEIALTQMLVDGLATIPRVQQHGPRDAAQRTAVASFIVEGRRPSEIGLRLDEEYGILCRVGLHCAPATHRTIGTFPCGTVRMAPGLSTTASDVRMALEAVARVARR